MPPVAATTRPDLIAFDQPASGAAPEPVFPVADTPAGIGGWLILPAISLTVSPLVTLVGLVVGIAVLGDRTLGDETGHLALGMVADVALLGYTLVAAGRFFRKSSEAPDTMVRLLQLQLATVLVLFMMAVASESATFAAEYGKALLRSGIAAAIWIPYYRRSRRVKATFVNS